jgi:hypothetical protein
MREAIIELQSLKFEFAAGAAATVGLPIAGIEMDDTLLAAFSLTTSAVADDLSDEASISGVSEVEVVTVGTQSAGQFKLTLNAEETGNIAYDADGPTTVQTAIVALASVTAGDVLVVGSGSPWTVTFAGDLADQDVTEMTIADGDTPLSGGSGEGVSTTQAGAAAGGVTFATTATTGEQVIVVYVDTD